MAKRPRLTARDREAASTTNSVSVADAATLAFQELIRAEARVMIMEELPRLVEAEVQRQLSQITTPASSGSVAAESSALPRLIEAEVRRQLSQTTLSASSGLPATETPQTSTTLRSDSGVVKLQVGPDRKKFTTTVETLAKWEGSFFEPLVSGRLPTKREADGSIFIDRPHKHFGTILSFMHNPHGFQVPTSIAAADELRCEAEYYCLEELICKLRRLRASRLEGGMQVTSDKKDTVSLKGQDHAVAILDVPDPDKFNVTVNFTEETKCKIIVGIIKASEADTLGSKLGLGSNWVRSPTFAFGSGADSRSFWGRDQPDKYIELPPGVSKTFLLFDCRDGKESAVFASNNTVLARQDFHSHWFAAKKDRYLSIVFDKTDQSSEAKATVEFRVRHVLMGKFEIEHDVEYRPCIFFKGLAEVKVS